MALGNQTGTFEFKQESAELRIGMNPDTRFYSIGILGAPIIPTYVKSAESKTIRMEVQLTLRHDRDFSFAERPCLSNEQELALCPSEVSVGAIAMFQDDGSMYADKRKRWQHISSFFRAQQRTFAIAPPKEKERINRQRVYQHYAYFGQPEFGYLQVNVRYSYECPDVCPQRVKLSTPDLVSIENLRVPNQLIKFEKKQIRDYRPMTVVQ